MLLDYQTHLALLLSCTLTSVLLSGILVLTKRWHLKITADGQHGIQKVHQQVTPRIGGLSIYLSLLCSMPFISHETLVLLQPLCVALLPAFIAGFWEDCTKTVKPWPRLAATVASAVVAWAWTGYSIRCINVAWIDMWLQTGAIAAVLTALAVSGMANALNLIDGFNGLASGVVCIMLGAMSLVAFRLGDTAMLGLTLTINSVTLGFFFFNFPWGKLFLGDGGAYVLGLMVAWNAIMLSARHSDTISPWSMLLICAYPVCETLYSMWRRQKRNKRIDQPDRLHLHSLIHRRLVPRLFATRRRMVTNALTSPFLWGLTAGPAVIGVTAYTSTPICMGSLGVFALLYGWIYRALTAFGAKSRCSRFRRPPPCH